MSLTENSNQVFLPGGATNSQNSPYMSVWPLDQMISSQNYGYSSNVSKPHCVTSYILRGTNN